MASLRRTLIQTIIAATASLLSLPAHAGIETPDKVDAIANKPESPYVIMLMTSSLPWSDQALVMIETKLRHYIHFVKSGQLAQDRPATQGKKVRVILAYELPPTEAHVSRLSVFSGIAMSENIQFVWGGKADVLALASAP